MMQDTFTAWLCNFVFGRDNFRLKSQRNELLVSSLFFLNIKWAEENIVNIEIVTITLTTVKQASPYTVEMLS